MGLLFRNDLHDEFGTWPLGYIPYGGADYGEVSAVAAAVGDGDDEAFCDAWCAAGDRLAAEAAENEAAGRRASARDGWLRAACFYGAAYRPIFGAPVNPRLLAAYRRQIAAFDRGLAAGDADGHSARRSHHARLSAAGRGAGGRDAAAADPHQRLRRHRHRPVFRLGRGGDATRLSRAGLRRAGAGRPALRAGGAAAAGLGKRDRRRGRRGAGTAGHRSAALWSMLAGFTPLAAKLGIAVDASTNLAELDEPTLSRLNAAIEGNRKLRWSFVQRGYWVHGVKDLRGYLESAAMFTLDGRAGEIRCPTLLAAAGDDTLSASVQRVMDGLSCPKTLIRFTRAEGAGDHCEMMNRSLLNRRTLDWLDGVLGLA